MGTVYRKTFTKPLPPGTEIFTRKGQGLAKWKAGKNRTRTKPVTVGQDGQDRLIVTAGTFTAKYRNGRGHVVEVPTGCRDERNHRLLSNPFASVPKADAKQDPRRKRRALDEGELVRLLGVARRRPLLDAMTVRRGKHKGEAVALLRDETRQRLELLGRERALTYKTLILTGLRKRELHNSGHGVRCSGDYVVAAEHDGMVAATKSV